jgi:hypothetical protein
MKGNKMTIFKSVLNKEDLLDSRDIIDRIQDLAKFQIEVFNEQQSLEDDDDLQIEEEDYLDFIGSQDGMIVYPIDETEETKFISPGVTV